MKLHFAILFPIGLSIKLAVGQTCLPPVLPDEGSWYPNSTSQVYYFLAPTKGSFEAMQDYCQNLVPDSTAKTNLARIGNDLENQLAISQSSKKNNVWLGGVETDGNWYWANPNSDSNANEFIPFTEDTYQNWDEGEPQSINNGPACLKIMGDKHPEGTPNKWASANCVNKQFWALCEYRCHEETPSTMDPNGLKIGIRASRSGHLGISIWASRSGYLDLGIWASRSGHLGISIWASGHLDPSISIRASGHLDPGISIRASRHLDLGIWASRSGHLGISIRASRSGHLGISIRASRHLDPGISIWASRSGHLGISIQALRSGHLGISIWASGHLDPGIWASRSGHLDLGISIRAFRSGHLDPGISIWASRSGHLGISIGTPSICVISDF